jgi:hypothetical protein
LTEAKTTIAFNYLGRDVPPGEETWLRVYHWSGSSWQPLVTELDPEQNIASAFVDGEGIYALMSTFEIPLYGPGWNLIAYPITENRLISDALQSISGTYTMVYGYDANDAVDPWKLFAPDAPDWVNDLERMEFGHGYWIYVTRNTILRMQGAQDFTLNTPSVVDNFGAPPATFFGSVRAFAGFSPQPGMEITAWIDGHQCGQSTIQEINGQIVYAINVFAEDPSETSGCGRNGSLVSFKVVNQLLVTSASWQNTGLQNLLLEYVVERFLPVIRR